MSTFHDVGGQSLREVDKEKRFGTMTWSPMSGLASFAMSLAASVVCGKVW
jgi:hypothetical protein